MTSYHQILVNNRRSHRSAVCLIKNLSNYNYHYKGYEETVLHGVSFYHSEKLGLTKPDTLFKGNSYIFELSS